MRPFLVKFVLLVLVILVILGAMEYYVRQIDNSAFKHRRAYFEDHKQELKGIIFGPSHICRAINPALLPYPVALLGMHGGAPEVDHLLFQRFIDEAEPDFILMDLSSGYLDNFVPPGYFDKNRLFYYFDIHRKAVTIKDYFLLRTPIRHALDGRMNAREKAYNEHGFATEITEKFDKFAAAGHDTAKIKRQNTPLFKIILHNRFNDQNNLTNSERYREIAAICAEKGIELIFVNPPKYYLYNKEITPKHAERRQVLLDELMAQHDNIQYWELSAFGEREPTYFLNVNHVSPRGAEAFTAEIEKRLAKVLD